MFQCSFQIIQNDLRRFVMKFGSPFSAGPWRNHQSRHPYRKSSRFLGLYCTLLYLPFFSFIILLPQTLETCVDAPWRHGRRRDSCISEWRCRLGWKIHRCSSHVHSNSAMIVVENDSFLFGAFWHKQTTTVTYVCFSSGTLITSTFLFNLSIDFFRHWNPLKGSLVPFDDCTVSCRVGDFRNLEPFLGFLALSDCTDFLRNHAWAC